MMSPKQHNKGWPLMMVLLFYAKLCRTNRRAGNPIDPNVTELPHIAKRSKPVPDF